MLQLNQKIKTKKTMQGSIENSSSYGEMIRGVGVQFGNKKKLNKRRNKKQRKAHNKGKVAYNTYE